jgi:hypothetical protein
MDVCEGCGRPIHGTQVIVTLEPSSRQFLQPCRWVFCVDCSIGLEVWMRRLGQQRTIEALAHELQVYHDHYGPGLVEDLHRTATTRRK